MGYGARTDSRSLGTAVAVGIIMWLLGLAVTFVLGVIGLARPVSLAMAFFGVLPGGLAGFVGLHSFDAGLFVLVPIIFLVPAGFFMGAGGARNPVGGFKEGAKVAAGYTLLTFLAMVFLLLLFGGGGVDVIEGTVSAGIVFPVVFGGIGGALGASL